MIDHYITSVPTRRVPDWTQYGIAKRRHIFPTPSGGEMACAGDRLCRECNREATWAAGQVRG